MWRSVSGVLLLTVVSLSGCLSGDTKPVVDEVPPIAFMDGDRVDWSFEGTGTFRAVIQPGEHVNLRFKIEHDTIEDWCRSSVAPDPAYVAGAFTAIALHKSGQDPTRNGAQIIRMGHSEDIQTFQSRNMRDLDGCVESGLMGLANDTSAVFSFASSVPGFRVSIYDQHAADEPAFVPIALEPFAAVPAAAPEPSEDGTLDQSDQRVQWTTTWQKEYTGLTGSTLFLALRWRDAEDTTLPQGDPADRGTYEDQVRLVRTDTSEPETVDDTTSGGTGGSANDNGRFAYLWAEQPGTYELVWEHHESRTTTTPRALGTWFVAVPLGPTTATTEPGT